MQADCGDKRQNLYFVKESASESWPWNFYPLNASEEIKKWNLPEAAGDPPTGLPPLPKRDLPHKPFRHLKWFGRKHAEIFFGRGREYRELYELVTDPDTDPIILFYGQSGVGKSSVLVAGLRPRLEASYDFCYRRRDQKRGLLQTLRSALLPEIQDLRIPDAWVKHEKNRDKPFVVVIDQVEEVFTRQSQNQESELKIFIESLCDVFGNRDMRPRGKLILGFRKEWLANIEKLLSDKNLPFSKVFLDRLDRCGIIEAVSGPARSKRLNLRFGLEVEEDLPETIANYLLEDLDSPVAPTLQILLTKMWNKVKGNDPGERVFCMNLYQELKREGIHLRDFLNQQLIALEKKREDEKLGNVVKSGLALDVLFYHTTSLGTAEEHKTGELKAEYGKKEATVDELVGQCKDLYLIAEAPLKASLKPRNQTVWHMTHWRHGCAGFSTSPTSPATGLGAFSKIELWSGRMAERAVHLMEQT